MKLWHYIRLQFDLDEAIALVNRLGVNRHIVLDRKNYLRVGVSAMVAKSSGEYHVKKGQKTKTVKVYLKTDDQELINGIKLHERFYNEVREKLREDFLDLCYENDIQDDPRIGYQKIMRYLGYVPKPVKTQLKKTNPQTLSSIIENYDDVSDYLKNTPYAWMIKT